MSECLVSKAMDECQCEWCKQQREFRNMLLQQTVKWEMLRTIAEGLKSKTKSEEKKNE